MSLVAALNNSEKSDFVSWDEIPEKQKFIFSSTKQICVLCFFSTIQYCGLSLGFYHTYRIIGLLPCFTTIKLGFSLLAKGFSIHDSAIAVTTQPALVVALHQTQAAQAAQVASQRLAGWASRPSLAMSRKMSGWKTQMLMWQCEANHHL